MSRYRYYTATTLDGFLADEHDSLDWLFVQEQDEDGALGYADFITDVGAIVMGATTYAWIGNHLRTTGEAWSYDVPCFVFTHRTTFEPLGDDVRFVAGEPAGLRSTIEAAAGTRDVWMVGGGDLAAQFAEAGMLDQVLVSIAPVTLGAGRPLFPRRFDLRLTEVGRNGAFVCATYDVVGPR